MIGNREFIDILISSGWESILQKRFSKNKIGRECLRDVKSKLDNVFSFLHGKGY